MTFAEMCQLDDRLLAICQEATKIARRQKTNPDKNYCKTQTWHALPRSRGLIGLKYLLTQVVGFGARVEALSTPQSYDRAYQTLLQTLPPCAKGRRCQCNVDFAIPALTPEELHRIDAGTLVVLKRQPELTFAPLGAGGVMAKKITIQEFLESIGVPESEQPAYESTKYTEAEWREMFRMPPDDKYVPADIDAMVEECII